MEKSRRLMKTSDAPDQEPDEATWDDGEAASRIAALKEEKRRFVDSATEADIRDVLAQSGKRSIHHSAPKKESLLEWAQRLEAAGNISGKVNAQISEDHKAVGATGRLADLVAKDDDMVVKDFLIEERRQKLRAEQTGEKPTQPARLMHNLEKVSLHRVPRRADVLEQARAAFAVFDLDGDGRITADSFAKVMHSHGEAEQMFRVADADGNGAVDYEEFVRAFTHHSLRPPGWVNPAPHGLVAA